MMLVIAAVLVACALWLTPPRRLRHAHAPAGLPTEQASTLETANDLDLLTACLQAGLSPAAAVHTVANCSHNPRWAQVATLMHMGAPAHRAWQPLEADAHCRELVALARASGRTGAGMQEGCARLAEDLRRQASHLATAKAQRAGVLMALPLSLCFLPAFFLLGLIPVIVDLGMELLGGLNLSK